MALFKLGRILVVFQPIAFVDSVDLLQKSLYLVLQSVLLLTVLRLREYRRMNITLCKLKIKIGEN